MKTRDLILFAFVAGLIVLTGFLQSWNTALLVLKVCWCLLLRAGLRQMCWHRFLLLYKYI